MYLDKLEWIGSTDLVEFHLATNKANDAFEEITKTLVSMLPRYWTPYLLPDGKTYATRDQATAWMAKLADVHDANGFVVVARHKSAGNHIIAVAIAERTRNPGEALQGPQTRGGYCAEDVDPKMLAVLRKACFDAGHLVLGNPEQKRIWVAA